MEAATRRREILERLNTLDSGPTEDDRKTMREAQIRKAIEAEGELKWGRVSAGSLWGFFGSSAEYR